MRWTYSASECEEATAFFSAHGFVGFDDMILPHEVEGLQRAAENASYSDDGLAITFDAIFAVPFFADYARDKRLAGTAATLIGAPVELYNSKLNAKPLVNDAGGIVAWHQDYPFHPHTNFDCLAGVIHLDDEDENSAPLQVLPGSHLGGAMSHSLDGEFVGHVTADLNTEEAVSLTCKAGTVIFHHCLLAHYSGPKRRPGYRRHLIFGYRAQDAIQLGGKVWKSTGMEVMPRVLNTARFPDGMTIELRRDFRLTQ